jgi:hypothetical protein
VQCYLSSSLDGKNILFTNNDETCCAGVNYTNNLLISLNGSNGKTKVVYDEWSYFKNYGKPEEHVPQNADFSPDGKWIATTIRNFYDPSAHTLGSNDNRNASGNVTANYKLFVLSSDGIVKRTLTDRELIGWLDDRNLLMMHITENYHEPKWTTMRDRISVFDIQSAKEYPLLSTEAECLGIQWRSLQ